MKKFLAWCGSDIQLRIEQSSDEPGALWRCRVIRRPTALDFRDQSITVYHVDPFVARSEEIAKEGSEATIRYCYPELAHELTAWADLSDMSEAQWRVGEEGWVPPT